MKPRLFKSLAVLGGTLGALLVCELTVRTLNLAPRILQRGTIYIGWNRAVRWAKHPYYPDYQGGVPAGYMYAYNPGSSWATQYPSNPRGYFDDRNRVTYSLNAQGFRGRDFSPKPPGSYRIAAIGDSWTFGEGVRLEHTYPVRLEQLIAASTPGPACDVLNLGINGYGVRDHLVLLDQIPDLQLDALVFGYVLNDISHFEFDRLGLELRHDEQSQALLHVPSRLLNVIGSRFWMRAVSSRTQAFVLDLYEADRFWNELADRLRDLAALVSKRNLALVVVIFPDLDGLALDPYPYAPIHGKLHALFDELGVRYIDMTDCFREHGAEALRVHPADAHPNEIAHELIAAVVSPWAVERVREHRERARAAEKTQP